MSVFQERVDNFGNSEMTVTAQTVDTILEKIHSCVLEGKTPSENYEGIIKKMENELAGYDPGVKKIRARVECADCLLQLERTLVPPSDQLSLVQKCEIFAKASQILGRYQGLTPSRKDLLPVYWRRLQFWNPFKQLVRIWNEAVLISPESIKVRNGAAESIAGLKKLEKLKFFEDKVLTAVIRMLHDNRPLSFANLTLSVSDRREENPFQNIKEVGKFLIHLHNMGVNFNSQWIAGLETELVTTYFNPQVPADEANAREITAALSGILNAAKALNVNFGQISAFKVNLSKMIKHAKTAKLIEKARQIIMNPNLVGTILPSSEKFDVELDAETGSYEVMIPSDAPPVQTVFQNHDRPISQRCAQIWKIIIENASAARMIITLFITLTPNVYESVLSTSLEACCIFNNDTEWLICGLKKLSFQNKLDEKDTLLSVSLISNLQYAAGEQLKIHIIRSQGEYREILENKLRLFKSLDAREDREELSSAFTEIAVRYNVAKTQMMPYFSDEKMRKILCQISEATMELIAAHILSLETIPSESCESIAAMLQKCHEFQDYDSTAIQTIQFLLTSSLPEIIKRWKGKEMRLDATQVRSMIRARFPPSEHRTTAVAMIM